MRDAEVIAAADVGASNVGLCLWNGTFRPSSWHPSEDGPGSDIDFQLEARRLMEWRTVCWSWLVGEGIEDPEALDALVALAYDDAPEELWPIAKLSLESHLLELERQGRAACDSGTWRPASRASEP